jgi:hypothetical protein
MLGAAWFGAPGVLIGQAFGGAIFAAAAYVLARRVMANDTTPTDAPFARQGRLMQLFHYRR